MQLVYLEDLTFSDQMQLFRNSGIIIATHGAGLTNLIFSENPLISEFFPSDRTNRDAFYFYQISNELNFHHHVFEYESINDMQDISIDEKVLEPLDSLFSETSLEYRNWQRSWENR